MTIKEVSNMLNISQDTLRYYEKVGVIPPVPRTKSGLRNYGEEEINWIQHVTCLRKSGLPIKTMIDYLNLYLQGDSTYPQRLKLLHEQYDEILKQKKHLETSLNRLSKRIKYYNDLLKNKN